MTAPARPQPLRIVIVTGLSGGGKASVLRVLEDLGYEAVDNPPLTMLEEMVARSERNLAIGIDARTRGFDAEHVAEALRRLRGDPALSASLVYVWAEEGVLLRRYTETRRRHPLAPNGRVADGIAQEQVLTAPLRERADLVLDTSDLPVAAMRRLVERHFDAQVPAEAPRMVVTLVSFAYPRGLPRDADLVFDARFLRNPHYDPILRPRTGMDPEVGAYVEADPAFATYLGKLTELLELLLPRFVQEGKKYATIAIGCTGGRHRSVLVTERLAAWLAGRAATAEAENGWRVHVAHRELAREGDDAAYLTDRPIPRRGGASDIPKGEGVPPSPLQAQEA